MYSKVEIYGQCDINYLHIKNGVDNANEIDDIVTKGLEKPLWEENSVMLSNCENSINGTPLAIDDSNVIGYQVYRFDVNENTMHFVAEITEGAVQDYIIRDNDLYRYYIFPIIEGSSQEKIFGNPVVTDEFSPKLEMCTVVGLTKVKNNEYKVDTNNIWQIHMNVELSDYQLNTDKTFTDGFVRFPRKAQGVKKYISSSLSGILGTIDCTERRFNISARDIERWETFCYSSGLKLINDGCGRVLPIDIKSVSTGYMEGVKPSPLVTKIEYIQMADINKLTIYGLGGE